MKLFFSLVLALLISSCATAKKTPVQAGPNVTDELQKIEIDINAGATDRAIKRLNTLVAQHSQTDAADDAYILLGKIYLSQGKYNESYNSYVAVINSNIFSPREVEAAYGASFSLYKVDRYDEALTLTYKALNGPNVSPDLLTKIHSLRYNIQTKLGDRLDALKSLVFLAQNSTDDALKSKYKINALEYVESRLTEEELKSVANDSHYGYVRAPALYKVGVTYFEQRDYSRAESVFSNLIKNFPNTDFSVSAKKFINQIEARRRVSPYTVGAVLPLSGRHEVIAKKTLRGLQMGLGIYGRTPSQFKLAIIDSESNPDVARRAVERLVVEDSVSAIVGDLISKTAEPVAQKAEELGVPVISFSQKSHLTRVGENVFRNALTSQAIVQNLVSSAIKKYGHKKFAILYPNDPYGVEYANLFWDEVLANGGEITAAQSYNKKERDLNSVVARLVGTYYVEDRADEYFHLAGDWYSKQKSINSRTTPPADLLPPIINFEALFIPDDVRALGQVASMLVYNDVKGVRLLGTNLWNTPSLVSRGTDLINNALFVDAKSSVNQSFKNTIFAKQFKRLFNEDPTIFEAQAYDTGVALRKLIESGSRSRSSIRESLAKMGHFTGAIGEIYVTQYREFTRPLTLLTVTDGKIEFAKEPLPIKTN